MKEMKQQEIFFLMRKKKGMKEVLNNNKSDTHFVCGNRHIYCLKVKYLNVNKIEF